MFQNLLKKYIFIFCASISSTACLAMETPEDDFFKSTRKQKIEESFKYGTQNGVNTIFYYMEKSENVPLFLSNVFKCWPDKIKPCEADLDLSAARVIDPLGGHPRQLN